MKRRWWLQELSEGDEEEGMEPGGELAVDKGCTCRARMVRPTDTEPPEVTVDKWCPIHGRSPDDARDEAIERGWDEQ